VIRGQRDDYSSAEFKTRIEQEMADYNLSLVRVVGRAASKTFQRGEKPVAPDIEETLNAAENQIGSGADTFSGRDEGDSPSAIFIIAALRLSDSDNATSLILAREFPPELTERAATISEQHENFHSLLGKIKRIKAIYILLLAAVTLLLIFSASWLALYVARGITIPIQALAEATDRIAKGDFARPVETVAEDELAVLVKSFNQMAAMLSENRERLERAADDLSRINLALDNRRRYIETVLESLSTGVIATDEEARLATINRSALWMLGLADKPEIGTHISRMIEGPQGDELAALCRRARRSETAQTEIVFKRGDGSLLSTATTAIALHNSKGAIEGLVIVIEDLTDLIQAERAAAWSEVALRMAHEIKNPLTPIQLSAERIIRNYERGGAAAEPRLDQIIHEGTSTIVREVAALQRMVEEFSRFARLPEARPVEASLNEVVRDAVGLYAERLDGIRLDCRVPDELPVLMIDPEQIKRVLINLIDNAIEALAANGADGNGHQIDREKLITLEALHLKSNDVVRLSISDTGHGISPRDRDKLFLPKFSTRSRGTGLGLAIVSHIVADHKGRVWVEDNQPHGARFVIELPIGRSE